MDSAPKRWWDFPSALLLIMAITVSAGRLDITEWTKYLILGLVMGVLGTILGLALGVSRFTRRAVWALSFGYTLIIIPLQLTAVVGTRILVLSDELRIVGERLALSIAALVDRQPVEDPLFFLTLVMAGYWIIGLTAGYYLKRHANYLAAVLPAGLVMLIIHLADRSTTAYVWFLAVYAFLVLLLLGRMDYYNKRKAWVKGRFWIVPDSHTHIFRGLFITTLVIVLVAWTIPNSISSLATLAAYWQRVTTPLEELSERISDAFASVEAGGDSAGEFYGDTLALGTATPNSRAVVFSVLAPVLEDWPARFYWRGRVYDRFENSRWVSDGYSREEFVPGHGNLALVGFETAVVAEFIFTSRFMDQSLLYTPTRPLWVDQPGQISLFYTTTGAKDPLAWYANPHLTSNDTYTVRTEVINPTTFQLREAGQDYPEWVTDRYLQLPDDFSPRVRALAEELAADLETPYEKAAAITFYLRRTIRYSTTIPQRPDTRDPMDWFLFDQQKGFCNYYASAEVLMLRSVGVPARLAVGFAQGQFNASTDTYTVTWMDTHAWPEVYFPGIGWVEFEPTANQPPLNRPRGLDPGQETARDFTPPAPDVDEPTFGIAGVQDPTGDTPGGETTAEQGQPFSFHLPVEFSIGLAGIVLLLVVWLLDRRYFVIRRFPIHINTILARNEIESPDWLTRWVAWVELLPVERDFAAINWSLRRMKNPPQVHATAAERAGKLKQLLPNAASEIESLASEHETAMYTPEPANEARARSASLVIRWRTVQALLRDRFQPVFNLFSQSR
ncbi:MAG: transglutaminaseTgpA domain-containing protein [Chloroflexota bacterium]